MGGNQCVGLQHLFDGEDGEDGMTEDPRCRSSGNSQCVRPHVYRKSASGEVSDLKLFQVLTIPLGQEWPYTQASSTHEEPFLILLCTKVKTGTESEKARVSAESMKTHALQRWNLAPRLISSICGGVRL